jgi:uncharacterized protein with HEPN domain
VKDDRVYLQHIQDTLNDIASYCSSDREGFFNDRVCLVEDPGVLGLGE